MKGFFGFFTGTRFVKAPQDKQSNQAQPFVERRRPAQDVAIKGDQPDEPKYVKNLLYEADEWFTKHYEEGIRRSGTPDRGDKRRERFYNLIQFLSQTHGLEGDIAECGCWKGLSSYLMCNRLRDDSPGFDGAGYHIFDSFEGLSEPKPEDIIQMDIVQKGRPRQGKFFKPAGSYEARQDEVAAVLNEFPNITFHKGWIPQSLEGLPERQYRFVHVDLDLYEPTKGAVAYFFPRLVSGGIILCDDYGSLLWPGAKQALDEYAAENNLKLLSVSSGQGIFWKR